VPGLLVVAAVAISPVARSRAVRKALARTLICTAAPY
jgi:hypothetical protein